MPKNGASTKRERKLENKMKSFVLKRQTLTLIAAFEKKNIYECQRLNRYRVINNKKSNKFSVGNKFPSKKDVK